MHSLTHFHEQQRGHGCGTYGDVGDKGYDFVVTKDGEVYYRRNTLFGLGSDSYYYLRYSALSKKVSGGFFDSPYSGDAAAQITSKAIASWNDYETAKKYADNVVVNARKGLPSPGSPLAPGGDTGGGPGDGSGAKTALVVVGVLAALGGLGYAASKLRAPSEVT
jgi:hypothetical protein